ncbi:MAG TPA: hypothetical protein VF139_12450 [Candidatus Polarisedimenticolaceae bacterium]
MRSPGALIIGLLAATVPALAQTSPLVREPAWEVTVEWVRTGEGQTASLARQTLTVLPGTEDRVRGTVAWPGRGDLAMSASGRYERAGDETTPDRLAFTFEVALGATPVTARRTYPMIDGGSEIVEVAREGEFALLALIRAERTWRARLRPVPSGVVPFIVNLAVSRLDGERVVALETNVLHTFVGEPVEYSFRFGAGDDEQILRVVLTPLRIDDDLADLRVQVTGKLPASPAPVVLSRDQRMVASRGSTSSLDVVSGDPPAGYRFSVTPDF